MNNTISLCLILAFSASLRLSASALSLDPGLPNFLRIIEHH